MIYGELMTNTELSTHTTLTTLSKQTNGVTLLGLNAPPLNPLSTAMQQELLAVLESLETCQETRAVVIHGHGKAFSAGAEISELPDLADPDKCRARVELAHQVAHRLVALPHPTIAAIDGAAVGGGAELALACDFRVMSSAGKIGLPEVNLGLIPGAGGTQLLVRAVGYAAAAELIFSGDIIDSERALSLGLIQRAVDNGTALEEAERWAEQLAAKPHQAVLQAKRAMLAAGQIGGYDVELDAFVAVTGSPDGQEGIEAFLQKRQPVFQHQSSN